MCSLFSQEKNKETTSMMSENFEIDHIAYPNILNITTNTQNTF